ncbi:hypothetical protein [Flavobacterium terrisoli]|uniref:hypothetical protein n=1 Tax=Flavobacterium terrisoli TaxID=3242195 RepID=UPI0025430E0C|nr:hypothetical protein [Flavobacterium buctense]
MKSNITPTLIVLYLLLNSCVQKSFNRIVVVTLDVSKVKDIQSVGIRGNGKPLNWEIDYPMQEMVKDSLYKAIIITNTGYFFTEVKCTVNSNFELQDKPNRRIVFDTKKDTTYVHLIFDKE